MRRVVGPTAACDKLRCRLEGSRVVVCVLHAGTVLQLSALHGHRIPRLPPLRRVREIPVLYRSRSGAAGLCRADGTSLVPAAAVDFHAVYLLESLALHRPEFRNFDDVCPPRGTLANKSRERGAAPCFHGLVSDAALQLPYGALGRRAYSFLGTASKVHLARARHARPIFHRGQRMGISFACEAQQLESAVADGDAGDHTVSVVLVARSDRARERPGSAADPLLRRDPGGFTLGQVSLDYQLLPEKRGARGGSDLLEFRALPARTGGGRHRSFCARTLDREPAVSRRFCLQLSDVHGARKPSPFHAGRSDLEVARLARRCASPGQSGAPSGQGPRSAQSGRRLRPLAGGRNFRGARPARWHRRGAPGLGRDGPLAFLLGKRVPESVFSPTSGATESARQRTRDAAGSRSSSGGKQ